jgi:hypothetical protein
MAPARRAMRMLRLAATSSAVHRRSVQRRQPADTPAMDVPRLVPPGRPGGRMDRAGDRAPMRCRRRAARGVRESRTGLGVAAPPPRRRSRGTRSAPATGAAAVATGMLSPPAPSWHARHRRRRTLFSDTHVGDGTSRAIPRSPLAAPPPATDVAAWLHLETLPALWTAATASCSCASWYSGRSCGRRAPTGSGDAATAAGDDVAALRRSVAIELTLAVALSS